MIWHPDSQAREMWQGTEASPPLLRQPHCLCAGAQRGFWWEEECEEVKNDKPMNSSDMNVLANQRPLPQRHGRKEANQGHESLKSGGMVLGDDRLVTILANYENFSKTSEMTRMGAVPWSAIVCVSQVPLQDQ